MRIAVLYFAGMRAIAGIEREQIETDCADLDALYAQLSVRHGWSFAQTALRVAVNGVLVAWSAGLNEGDEIAFLPPYSGG